MFALALQGEIDVIISYFEDRHRQTVDQGIPAMIWRNFKGFSCEYVKGKGQQNIASKLERIATF
jgi:hypothetical protein